MPTFDVALIHEQGVDFIIIPMDSSFQFKSSIEKDRILKALQSCADAAKLSGMVVPVWDAGGGRMDFMASPHWNQFQCSIDLRYVIANISRQLTCSLKGY